MAYIYIYIIIMSSKKGGDSMTYYEEQMVKHLCETIEALAKEVAQLSAAIGRNNEQLQKSCELAERVHQSTKKYFDEKAQ